MVNTVSHLRRFESNLFTVARSYEKTTGAAMQLTIATNAGLKSGPA